MGNAYIMVVLGILLAKGVGFYRDMVFAGAFGTSVEADIYFQIFGLVNLIFTGVGVALSTLVIKNINKSENKGKEKAYATRFIKKSLFYLIIVAFVMVLIAPLIVKVVLPELDQAYYSTALSLTYVMIPSMIFVVVAYIISGILQNEKAYFITSVMSLPFNALIITTLYFKNVSLITVGIVTTIGWLLHILTLLPSFYKKGYSLFLEKEKPEIVSDRSSEIFYIFISNMMFQLCFYTDRAFLSASEGMASTFNYASNLFVTISSVFVVAMSTVVFPSISKNYEEGHVDYVNELLRYIISIMSAIFLPFLLVVGLFGPDVIRLVYERGSFTHESTLSVAFIFFIYALGILGYISQELFNKILYQAGKYKYTVLGTIIVVLANALFNYVIKAFVPDVFIPSVNMSLPSILTAASTSLLLLLYAIFVAIGIKKVVGPYWSRSLLRDLGFVFLSGASAVLVYCIFNLTLPEFTHGYITFIIPLLACGTVYIAVLFATGVLKRLIKRK